MTFTEQHAEVTENLTNPRTDCVHAAGMEAFLEVPHASGILDIAFSRGPKDWLSRLVGRDILLIHFSFSLFFSLLILP